MQKGKFDFVPSKTAKVAEKPAEKKPAEPKK
jgi:hypothetical protein